jgi:hypothetical protein
MKRAAKRAARPTMKSPDLFRRSYQTFDKKTGERLSYLDALEIEFNTQPEPEPIEEDNNQLNLFP